MVAWRNPPGGGKVIDEKDLLDKLDRSFVNSNSLVLSFNFLWNLITELFVRDSIKMFNLW